MIYEHFDDVGGQDHKGVKNTEIAHRFQVIAGFVKEVQDNGEAEQYHGIYRWKHMESRSKIPFEQQNERSLSATAWAIESENLLEKAGKHVFFHIPIVLQ